MRRWSERTWMPGVSALLIVLPVLLPARAEDSKTLGTAAFADEIAGFQQLAQACEGAVTACDASGMPPTQQVQGGPAGSFQISWGWFGEALSSAKTASGPDRKKAMREVRAHLAELAAQANVRESASAPGEFNRARTAAKAALARDEFRAADGPSWIDRQLAKLQDAILRLFTGMGRLGQRAPWLAPLVEWSCFGLAAAGLLWSVRQSLTRQSLRISLSEGAALAGRGEHETADWGRRAEERAAAKDWREAVHSLYWAAISLLEGRRAWRSNAARTPREHLALLQPGSEAHRALRELTRSFELVWYGQGEAQEGQYNDARDSFRLLESARTQRAAAARGDTGAAPLTAGSLS